MCAWSKEKQGGVRHKDLQCLLHDGFTELDSYDHFLGVGRRRERGQQCGGRRRSRGREWGRGRGASSSGGGNDGERQWQHLRAAGQHRLALLLVLQLLRRLWLLRLWWQHLRVAAGVDTHSLLTL